MALRRGRAPSHSLTTQAMRSWPSRLTTAINPSKNQECKRQPSCQTGGPTCSLATCSPARLSRLWHSTRLDIRVRGALFRCAQTRRAHNNGALPIVLTRLHNFSQGVLSAISWPFRALQKRPARSKCPPRAQPNQTDAGQSAHSEAVSASRHVLTRPVATNRLVPPSARMRTCSPN